MSKDGWEIKKLGDVCEIIGGTTPSTSKKEYWNGTEKWITPAEVKIENKYITDSVKHITKKAVKDCSLQKLPIGTVIFSSRAPIGKVAISNTELYCNQGFKNFVCGKNIFNEYLYYFLYANTEYLNSIGKGTTFKEVSKSVVSQVQIPLPPLAEQKRIVKILDEKFATLEQIKSNAQKNLDNAKELFQAELSKSFSNKNWEKKRLGDVCDVRDGTHDSPRFFSTGFPLVTSKNLKQGKIDMSNVKFISKEDLDKINQRSKVNIGDILFAMIGTIGNPVLVKEEPNYAIKNMALFKPRNTIKSEFLTYYLSSSLCINKMITDSKGSTQRFVSLGYLRDYEILLPPLAEQEHIVKHLDAVQSKVRSLQEIYTKTLSDCDELKQSFLSKAFNGEM